MKRAARGTSETAFGEEMPTSKTGSNLRADKDEFGMPLGKIIHSFDQDAARCEMQTSTKASRSPKAQAPKEVCGSAAICRPFI